MDPETVEKARRGCPEALEALLRGLVPPLLALARRLAGDTQDAEDLVSEALYRGWVRLGKLRDPGAAVPWFRRILLNVWKDSLRRKTRKQLFLEDARETGAARGEPDAGEPEALAAFDPAARAEAAELREGVDRALAALPPGQRAVMSLRLEGDLSVAEIAKALGTTAERVKANLWHARRKLRSLLGVRGVAEEGPGAERRDAPRT
ncbi:MAG: sigma-70 family RNA polymerase sigma factor [Planctomycetes bacterium]|nr:sigma-70 family RNA polymerase sigma factor [Planctomycetota bacterium]